MKRLMGNVGLGFFYVATCAAQMPAQDEIWNLPMGQKEEARRTNEFLKRNPGFKISKVTFDPFSRLARRVEFKEKLGPALVKDQDKMNFASGFMKNNAPVLGIDPGNFHQLKFSTIRGGFGTAVRATAVVTRVISELNQEITVQFSFTVIFGGSHRPSYLWNGSRGVIHARQSKQLKLSPAYSMLDKKIMDQVLDHQITFSDGRRSVDFKVQPEHLVAIQLKVAHLHSKILGRRQATWSGLAWVFSVRYQNFTWTLYVSARTGKLIGRKPGLKI